MDTQVFKEALGDVARLMQFESWLRFYFVTEEGDKLYVRIPEEALIKIQEAYPEYMGLVETMNNSFIDYESSMATLCKFVIDTLDGPKHPTGTIGSVFDSLEFQAEMQLFNVFTSSHEEQLDESFMDFETWMTIYNEWREYDKVKEYFESIRQRPIAAMQCSSQTLQ